MSEAFDLDVMAYLKSILDRQSGLVRTCFDCSMIRIVLMGQGLYKPTQDSEGESNE